MTEQIITKNLYSIVASGGAGNSSNCYTYIMPTTLSRSSIDTGSQMWKAFHVPNTDSLDTYYKLYLTNYPKALSEMTESEIYSHNVNTSMTNSTNYTIVDNKTNSISGLKWVATYTNTGSENKEFNGITLKYQYQYSSNPTYFYNLIHIKFDAPVIVAPTESYSFTLDLDNLFITFPSTLGS